MIISVIMLSIKDIVEIQLLNYEIILLYTSRDTYEFQ